MAIAKLTIRITTNITKKGGHVCIGEHPEIHDVESLDCWCLPTFFRPCDECHDGCWKCENGRIPLSKEEAAACDDPIVIVHNG